MNTIIANLVQTIMAAVAAQISESWAVGKVAAVSAGGAKDGNALLSVSWRGATVQAAYAASYTPVVGHIVLMARPTDQLVVICRIIGTP